MEKLLGKYKDDYEDVINEERYDSSIGKIYYAHNKNTNSECFLKVINKEKIKNQDYIFLQERLKKEQEIQTLCISENTINFYRRLETDDNIIFELEYWDDNLYNYLEENGELFREKNFLKKLLFLLQKL